MPFRVEDVHELLDVVRVTGIDVVVLGGWGVDALLGEQSRAHDDIDLWVAARDDQPLRDALGRLGYAEVDGGVPQNFVLADERDRKVDVHLVAYRSVGGAVYAGASGAEYVIPPDAFTTGSIGGRPVRCVSACQQMLDHAEGYEPGETDHQDMRLLHERLGARYQPPFGGAGVEATGTARGWSAVTPSAGPGRHRAAQEAEALRGRLTRTPSP